MMLYSETIKLILESLGKKDEIEYYLKRFRSENSEYFSIILPDYKTLDESFESFLLALEILYKLELLPIVFIGGPFYLNYIKKFNHSEFFEVIHFDDDSDLSQLFQTKNNKKILIIFYNNIFIKFLNQFKNILPRRIHFVRNTGYIKTIHNENLYQAQSLEEINNLWSISFKNSTILNEYEVSDIPLLVYCSQIFNSFPDMHLSITSSFLLLKELFTIKGAGTLIKRKTNIIHYKKHDISQDLLQKVKEHVELCFGKSLKENALKDITDVIIDENFQSMIVLEQKEFGYYLSKFAVTIEARGKGIAQDLWDYINSYNIPLFWKTNKHNFIKKWYEKICDGLIRGDKYIIFWKNLSYNQIPEIMDFIIKRGSDFYEDL